MCPGSSASSTLPQGRCPRGVFAGVPATITLTINPGTLVKSSEDGFLCGNGYAALMVEGTLDAVGSAASPIVFTSINDDSVGGATGTGKPAAGNWTGNHTSAGGTIDLEYADVDYASTAVTLNLPTELSSNDAFHNDWFDWTRWLLMLYRHGQQRPRSVCICQPLMYPAIFTGRNSPQTL